MKRIVNVVCGLFTAFMVIGRLVCGVHWFTDLLGGLIFSAAMPLLDRAANNAIDLKKNSFVKEDAGA